MSSLARGCYHVHAPCLFSFQVAMENIPLRLVRAWFWRSWRAPGNQPAASFSSWYSQENKVTLVGLRYSSEEDITLNGYGNPKITFQESSEMILAGMKPLDWICCGHPKSATMWSKDASKRRRARSAVGTATNLLLYEVRLSTTWKDLSHGSGHMEQQGLKHHEDKIQGICLS